MKKELSPSSPLAVQEELSKMAGANYNLAVWQHLRTYSGLPNSHFITRFKEGAIFNVRCTYVACK